MRFIRRSWYRYSKIGKRKKKKQVWRSPKGRDNNMREKRRGYSPVVSIGYKTNRKEIGKIRGKKPVLVLNLKELERVKKDEIVILGGVGKKKKIEIIKKAKEKGIEMANVNINKFMKQIKSERSEQIDTVISSEGKRK